MQEKQLRQREITCNRLQQKRDRAKEKLHELRGILDAREVEVQQKDSAIQVRQKLIEATDPKTHKLPALIHGDVPEKKCHSHLQAPCKNGQLEAD